jgi:tetratricopeptide (TPR) repeat protein
MTRESFPEIPQEALRSHAHAERVERVWRRLELDVARPSRALRAPAWWAPAALGIFGLGVFVGVRLNAPPTRELAAVAEPRPTLPAPGAAVVPERRAVAEKRADAPAPKHVRPARALPVEETLVEQYPESYGEPAVASEPLVAAGPAAWEVLAETGDFKSAKDALDHEGGFERVLVRASASQLLVLADIARASGGRDQAAQALKRVLLAYDSAPEAPIAAWTLGNLLDQAGDRAGAAEAYATYRRLSPTGDFAEDAAARQVDAALSQGNVELGTRALEEYAQNFPKGRRLAELRKRLAALSAPADASSPAVTEAEEDDEAVEPGADTPLKAPATSPAR